MSHKSKRFKSKAMFTFVGGMLIINPAFAQDAPAQDAAAQDTTQQTQQQTASDATTLDTIVVTGIRSSLNQAMGIKTSASSRTPTWRNRCSALPASRSSAAMARARRSPRVASARNSTWLR
jgi:hypothetical protein